MLVRNTLRDRLSRDGSTAYLLTAAPSVFRYAIFSAYLQEKGSRGGANQAAARNRGLHVCLPTGKPVTNFIIPSRRKPQGQTATGHTDYFVVQAELPPQKDMKIGGQGSGFLPYMPVASMLASSMAAPPDVGVRRLLDFATSPGCEQLLLHRDSALKHLLWETL